MLKSKTMRKRDFIFYLLLLALPLLQFIIFYIGVNFNSILLAFKNIDPTTGKESFIGFENFKRVFFDWKTMPLFDYAFKNSFYIYVLGLIISVPFAIVFSFYIYKKMVCSQIFRVLLFMPSIISPIVLTTMFSLFVESGIPEFIKIITDAQSAPIGLLANPDTTFSTLFLYSMFFGFGTTTLLYVGAMTNISESIVEAAKLDGCGLIQELMHITIPMIYPTLSVFLVTGIAGIFTNQLNLFSFYGKEAEHRYYTMGYYLFVNAMDTTNMYSYPYLSAMGLIITLIVAPITILVHKVLSHFDPAGGKQ